MITTMPRLPDDRDRVDHVLATIDGALESYGDAMRWSPDPPEEREDWLQSNVEVVTSSSRTPGTLSFYSGQIGDYAGVPIIPEDRARDRMDRIAAMPVMPILRSGQSVTFDVTYRLDLEFWEDAMAQARAAFDQISLAMFSVGESINRLADLVRADPPTDVEARERAMAAKARRGTGPTQTPWRHRNP